MEFEFDGVLIEWRGPAPYYFVPFPEGEAETLATFAKALTYGWGCIPVSVRLGDTTFTTSLFPRRGGYLVPVKDVVRRRVGVEVGATVRLIVTTGEPRD